jgi:nucleoside-diphosphate-sugar epimerase
MEGVVTLDRTADAAAPIKEQTKEALAKKVLVTGAEGYIGSVLTARLMARGHNVTGLDTGFYRAGWLFNDGKDRPRLLNRDTRTLTPDDLAGYDAVVHLAELSNDPLGEHNPEKTYQVNHLGSVELARNAKTAGVPRFIHMSSCSVYGAAGDEARIETSELNPQTAYAKCKILVERDVRPMADATFAPTFLRNATAFGASPRMRFDIVLNNLAGLAWTTKKIAMTSDGMPWRPIVHIQDISTAILMTLDQPMERVSGEIFNVGADAQNYRIHEIADAVGAVFPECEVTYGKNDGDTRSYRVSFDKIGKVLPGFKCEWDVYRGARQLLSMFQHIDMTPEMFAARPFTRVKELQRLVDSNQLDSNFRWNDFDFS